MDQQRRRHLFTRKRNRGIIRFPIHNQRNFDNMTLQDLKDKLEKGPDTWFKVFDKATGKVVAVTEAINDEKITYRFRVPANCDMKQIEKEEYDQLKTMLKNATLN